MVVLYGLRGVWELSSRSDLLFGVLMLKMH